MDEKILDYLKKNLAIAEENVKKFTDLDEEIAKYEDAIKLAKHEKELLGDYDEAVANVNEIKGFIEYFDKKDDDEVKEVVEADYAIASAPADEVPVAPQVIL